MVTEVVSQKLGKHKRAVRVRLESPVLKLLRVLFNLNLQQTLKVTHPRMMGDTEAEKILFNTAIVEVAVATLILAGGNLESGGLQGPVYL